MVGGGGWGGGVTYPKKMTSLFFKVRREEEKEENSRPAGIFGPSDCHAVQYEDQTGNKMQSILHFLQTFNLNSILKRSFRVEVLCMFISFPAGLAKFLFPLFSFNILNSWYIFRKCYSYCWLFLEWCFQVQNGVCLLQCLCTAIPL